jgi:hypothetical protein
MCRYAATNAPSFSAGTFEVINDIFGRTIKRRIIYFSVSPYSQCLVRSLKNFLLSFFGAFYCTKKMEENKRFSYDHYQHVSTRRRERESEGRRLDIGGEAELGDI